MKIERTKNSFRSTAFGTVNRIISLLVPFIIRTIIIEVLGDEYLGLNSLFTSILQVLSLTELGFGSAMVYNMYAYIATDDYDRINDLIRIYKKLYRIISLIIASIGLLLLPALPYIVDMESVNNVNINIYLLYAIYLANTVISYSVFGYKKSIIQAYQRNDLISIVSSIVHIVLYTAQIVILLVAKDYYLYAICMPISTALINLADAYCADKIYPHYVHKKSEINKKELSKIWRSVKALLGHKVGAVLITSSDSIVISMFMPLGVLAVYGNYHYVITALTGFINIVYTAILAGVGNCIATETKERIYTLFRQLSMVLAWIVGFCSTCLLCLYQPFMEVWVGEEYMFPFETVVVFVVYFYCWQIRVMGLNFKDAAGMWQNDFWKPYIGIIVNMIGNVVLIQWIGVSGVVISTMITMAFVYFPWETTILHRDLFECKALPYYLSQLKYVTITAVSCVTSYVICSLIPVGGILALGVRGVVCFVVFNAFFLAMNIKSEDSKEVFARMKNMLIRKKTV